MRKIRRAVLRNEANRLSHYGQNGKSIAIFRSACGRITRS